MSARSQPSRGRIRAAIVGIVALLGLAVVPVGWAQSDHSTVIRVLHQGRDFRARVRAALALGSTGDRSVTPHLVQALEDSSPAVRAAAATALGRLGDPDAAAPLRGLMSDRQRVVRNEARRALRRLDAAAPPSRAGRRAAARGPGGSDRYPTISVIPRARSISWPRVRYVVVLGSMENRSNFGDEALASVLQREIDRSLLVLRGVAVLHEGHEPAGAEREIRRRRLPKVRLEGSLNRVERRAQRRQLEVRCEVSIMLLEEPGRSIRSVLNGAATGTEPMRRGRRGAQEQQLAQQALTSAVRSAMSGAARAIASAGGR